MSYYEIHNMILDISFTYYCCGWEFRTDGFRIKIRQRTVHYLYHFTNTILEVIQYQNVITNAAIMLSCYDLFHFYGYKSQKKNFLRWDLSFFRTELESRLFGNKILRLETRLLDWKLKKYIGNNELRLEKEFVDWKERIEIGNTICWLETT